MQALDLSGKRWHKMLGCLDGRELRDAGGTAQNMADIMAGGLWGAIKAIASIVDSAYISFGQRLAPALQIVANLFVPNSRAPIQETVVIRRVSRRRHGRAHGHDARGLRCDHETAWETRLAHNKDQRDGLLHDGPG